MKLAKNRTLLEIEFVCPLLTPDGVSRKVLSAIKFELTYDDNAVYAGNEVYPHHAICRFRFAGV